MDKSTKCRTFYLFLFLCTQHSLWAGASAAIAVQSPSISTVTPTPAPAKSTAPVVPANRGADLAMFMVDVTTAAGGWQDSGKTGFIRLDLKNTGPQISTGTVVYVVLIGPIRIQAIEGWLWKCEGSGNNGYCSLQKKILVNEAFPPIKMKVLNDAKSQVIAKITAESRSSMDLNPANNKAALDVLLCPGFQRYDAEHNTCR